MIESLYAPKSFDVPDNLTAPTKSFKKHVILATIALFAFVIIYTALMLWFGYLAYSLFSNLGDENKLLRILQGVFMAFLFIFMLKSLFIFDKNKAYLGKELKPNEEPILFDYLYKLADEAGAPRPHKVFLSSRVNASVFYDLSIFNLILPSKKNLEIGLGLVNVLNIGEFKSILAHEFGHFAQRSMMLGRYVYTAQQIAIRVVNKRDALDKFLSGLSRVDIRIAWIGWILSVLVWAVRALIESIFSVVSIAEKALSREMEFQADLVAVSLTGSDALIHSLHKLRAADEGYHAALDIINNQLGEKKAVEDLFTLQTNYIEKMRWILSDSTFGKSPEKSADGASHRVFTSLAINPPEMWSTHPADNDREENAKQTYVYADIDERSSWDLFKDPKQLRLAVTEDLIKTANAETELISSQDSVEAMNKKNYSWSFLNPKYKGTFLSRFPLINFKDSSSVLEAPISGDLKAEYLKLYSQDNTDTLEKFKEVREEIKALDAVRYEVKTIEKRVIVHRGNRINRRDVDEVLVELKKEESALRSKIMEHDSTCRTVNQKAALTINSNVASYHQKLLQLLHYAEHSIVDLNDVFGKFNNTLQVVLADGRVSSSELKDVLNVSNEFDIVLKRTYDISTRIELNDQLTEKIGGKKYGELFPKYELGLPNKNNINDWVQYAPGWLNIASNNLSKLRNACMEEMLTLEDQIQKSFIEKATLLTINSESISFNENYPTLIPGKEREIKRKLGLWDRFHLGDGLVPSIAKFTVAASLVVGAIFFANYSSQSELYVYNGLAIPVNVSVNGSTYDIEPYDHEIVNIDFNSTNQIQTTTASGLLIEDFEAESDRRHDRFVYNIANSGMFIEYTVSYGYDTNEEDRFEGSPRWFATRADYILKDPPESITTRSSSGRTSKDVLMGYGEINPFNITGMVADEQEMLNMINSHALWDEESSKYAILWTSMAAIRDTTLSFAYERLKNKPNEVLANRILQNYLPEDEKEELCSNLQGNWISNNKNGDLEYLMNRCLDDDPLKDEAYLNGFENWPQNAWFAESAGYVQSRKSKWKEASDNFGKSIKLNGSFVAAFGLDMERINRMVYSDQPDLSDYDYELVENAWVSYYRQLEGGIPETLKDNFDAAYYMLNNVSIEESLSYAESFEEEGDQFIWYAASSKKASKNIINRAINSDYSTTVGLDNLSMAIALLSREGKNIDKLFEKYSENEGDFELSIQEFKSFLTAVKNKNFVAAEKIIEKMKYIESKAQCLMMGVIIHGDIAPESWKKRTKNLLFIHEKPNLGL